jgi:hypothetical protein
MFKIGILFKVLIWSLEYIGCGFQTKQKYRFGWFSMKLKLVGGDSAGVVTAYYVSLSSTTPQAQRALKSYAYEASLRNHTCNSIARTEN